MTDSTPPRTLRDEIVTSEAVLMFSSTTDVEPVVRIAADGTITLRAGVSMEEGLRLIYERVSELLTRDIRPHNEPRARVGIWQGPIERFPGGYFTFGAGVDDARLIPAGMTAEKLRDLAQLLEDLGLTLGLVIEKAEWLREWADVLAARDVGGDSPTAADEETK